MNWLFFAILSPALYAVVNFIDKYILEKEITDYKVLPVYTAIVSFFAGTIFWLAAGSPLLPAKDALIVILTGILTAWSLYLYFKVLAKEETSLVIFLFQLTPVFVLIFSFVFLRETISIKQQLGFFLVFTAVLIVSFKKTAKTPLSNSVFWLMILFDIISAFCAILIKYAVSANSFVKILSYESWGIFLGGLSICLFAPSIKKAFLKSLKTLRAKTIKILFINESLFVLAKALFFLAISLGPVALVSVLEGVQLFFGIAYGLILTFVFPKIFQEDISVKGLTVKITAALILFGGIVLIS